MKNSRHLCGKLLLGAIFAVNCLTAAEAKAEASRLIVKYRSEAAPATRATRIIQPGPARLKAVDAIGKRATTHPMVQPRVKPVMSASDFELVTVELDEVTPETEQQVIESLKADPLVEYVEHDVRVMVDPVPALAPAASAAALTMPNDPSFANQWHLVPASAGGSAYNANVYPIWEKGYRGSSDIIVAVIDTGVQYDHPDLAGNLFINTGETAGDGIDNDGNGYIDDVRGWNFIKKIGDASDDHSHGTHVSGIIGAVGNDGKGIVGVNWNVRIIPLKFLDAGGNGDLSMAIEALNYAVAMGAKVVNMSFGAYQFSQAFYDSIKAARGQGVIVAAAAANDAVNNDGSKRNYPSSFELDNIIAVASIDPSGQISDFSNYGVKSVDVAAPGRDVLSTIPGSTHKAYSGTSMATPVVAGALALLKTIYPAEDYKSLINRVMGCSKLLPAESKHKVWSGGALDVEAAVKGGDCQRLQAGDPAELAVTKLIATKLTVTWDTNVLRVEGFKVARQEGSMAPSCDTGVDTAFTGKVELTGLKPETVYSLRVCGYNSLGAMGDGTTLTVKTQPLIPPPAPSTVRVQDPQFATRVRVAWATGGGNTSGFRAAIAEGTTVREACSSLPAVTGTTFEATGLKPKTQYVVRICAENEDGLFSAPVDVLAKTKEVTIPGEVGSFSMGEQGVMRLGLKWSTSSRPEYGGIRESYIVKQAEGATAPASCSGGERINGNSAMIRGLKPATKYSIRICVDNNDGGVSPGKVLLAETIPAELKLTTEKIGSHKVKFVLSRNYDDVSTQATIRTCRISTGSPTDCQTTMVTILGGDTTVRFKVKKLRNKETPYRTTVEAPSVSAETELDFRTKKGWWIF